MAVTGRICSKPLGLAIGTPRECKRIVAEGLQNVLELERVLGVGIRVGDVGTRAAARAAHQWAFW